MAAVVAVTEEYDETESTIPATGSAPMDAYLEFNSLLAWAGLEVARLRQDDLPGLRETLEDRVLVTIGTTTRRVDGWFQACAWRHENRPVHELFVNADLCQGNDPLAMAEEILATILHELAHLWAHLNGIPDTSQGGRYHNGRFGEIAWAIGLEVVPDPNPNGVGVLTPRVSRKHRFEYLTVLHEIKRRLVLARASRPVRPGRGGRQPGDGTHTAKYVFASCQCQVGRSPAVTIRVARGSWRPDVIRCDACGNAFVESPTRERQAGRRRAGEES